MLHRWLKYTVRTFLEIKKQHYAMNLHRNIIIRSYIGRGAPPSPSSQTSFSRTLEISSFPQKKKELYMFTPVCVMQEKYQIKHYEQLNRPTPDIEFKSMQRNFEYWYILFRNIPHIYSHSTCNHLTDELNHSTNSDSARKNSYTSYFFSLQTNVKKFWR